MSIESLHGEHVPTVRKGDKELVQRLLLNVNIGQGPLQDEINNRVAPNFLSCAEGADLDGTVFAANYVQKSYEYSSHSHSCI